LTIFAAKNIIHAMNDMKTPNKSNIHPEQLRQFQSIMRKLIQCCNERIQHQSIRFNLPDAELRCLVLFDGERYLTPKSIANKMNVVKSRVTKIINGLINRDLIQKIKDPGDSRITLLSLTSKGQKKLNEILNFNNCIHEEVLIAMEPEQRKIMLTNLDILKASMESVRELMMRGRMPSSE
jgi:DNA-binding MarR family transcriptional regulator